MTLQKKYAIIWIHDGGVNMKERIKELRSALSLSQDDFGDRLGVKGSSISLLENGKRNITEQMALSICREFNVEYAWLKMGIGEMFRKPDDDLLGKISEILSGENETAKALFRAFAAFSESDWKTIQKLIDACKDRE